MVAKLTSVSEAGKPPTPITLNPDHVVELRPRYRPKPNLGSQTAGLLPNYEGSQALLVTGERVSLLEDYAAAHDELWPPFRSPVEDLVGGIVPQSQIPQSNISGLTTALAEAESTLSTTEGTPEQKTVDAEPPAKKAPGKKSKPVSDNANEPESGQERARSAHEEDLKAEEKNAD